jgi:lysophospholipase L1-like esterase
MKKKLKNIGIGFSITFNVLVVVILFWGLSGGLIKLINQYIFIPYHERSVTQFELLDVEPGSTVFLGNSITEAGKWHELFPESTVYNRGIAADMTTGVLARLDQITKGKPAQVFLLIGTNDLFAGIPQKEIVSNIVSIIKNIQVDSPQTEVFVQSILPRGDEYNSKVEALNLELEKAITGTATWINLYPLFLNEDETYLDSSLSNDGLHLMGQGYIIWRDAIAQYVKKGNKYK